MQIFYKRVSFNENRPIKIGGNLKKIDFDWFLR